MNQLFAFPEIETASMRRNIPLPMVHIASQRISVASKQTMKGVEYARLSDADHYLIKTMIEVLSENRASIKSVLLQPSRLYGSRGGGKGQALGDILDGLYAKMKPRHPFLQGRVGEDLTIKQLRELNVIIAAINTAFGSDFNPVSVP